MRRFFRYYGGSAVAFAWLLPVMLIYVLVLFLEWLAQNRGWSAYLCDKSEEWAVWAGNA